MATPQRMLTLFMKAEASGEPPAEHLLTYCSVGQQPQLAA
jgi:hypothetical protein